MITVRKAYSSKFIQLSLGIGISVVCLWLALRSVPLNELGRALSQANYLWLIPHLLLGLSLSLTEAQIWRVLLEKRVSLPEAFWAYNIGILFNNILPFRLGEPARITVLATHRSLPVVEVAATLGLKRLLDMVVVMVMLVVILPFMMFPLEVKRGALVFGALTIIGLIIVFILAKSGEWGEFALRRLVNPILPRYTDLVIARWRELVQGVAVLTRFSIGVPAVGLSILGWCLRIVAQWTILLAFQPLAGPVEAAFMVAAVSLAIAIPAAPGFIGVYQWVGEQALVIPFSNLYTITSALGIAITSHLIAYLLSNVLGVIGLWYFGQSFSGLGRKLNQLSKPAEVTAEV